MTHWAGNIGRRKKIHDRVISSFLTLATLSRGSSSNKNWPFTLSKYFPKMKNIENACILCWISNKYLKKKKKCPNHTKQYPLC